MSATTSAASPHHERHLAAQHAPPRGEAGAISGTRAGSGAGAQARTHARSWTRNELVALGGLLGATALLYLWGLGQSGWANSFYAAAAQAGSESWKAFFFGSSDAANSITVDKTPLSLWPMALSIRLFGLNSWALLVPQALMGVATVGLLTAGVRRITGSIAAGLLAGAVMALTPVAVLMFRFDNPDASLVLLLVAAAYSTLRATESPRPLRWLVLGGGLVGAAYLSKMLQAFLVLPSFALVYLLFAPAAIGLGRRLVHLLAAFGTMLAAAGWWVAIVELVPASMRPYIGGSQDNSILELTLGYNGLGRLTGNETGSVGGGGGGAAAGGGMWGSTGIFRLLNSENGGQASWLLPGALVLSAAVLLAVVLGRRVGLPPVPRPIAAGVTLWFGWLVTTWLTFSFMAGIFHAYYTVALAPAIAVCVAVPAWLVWQWRTHLVASATLAAATALSTSWAFVLLARADWHPWFKYAVATAGFASALMLAGVRLLPSRVAAAVAGVALVAVLAGPTAWSVATAATPHTGSIPTAGPASAQTGPGGMGRMGQPGQIGQTGENRTTGGAGGLLNASTPGAELTTLLEQDASSYTWVAAAVGSNSASGYQLATGEPVMAIGGFNGSDPSPTLAEFKKLVADGKIHWFIAGGGMGGFGGGPGGARAGNADGAGGTQTGGSSVSSDISTWVTSTFTATTVDGVTVYDLSAGA
jgi:4-amino-4-deoxy-L-arabinose transferase-like glycosyltransferase